MSATYTRKRAVIELLLATSFWGYGFIATILALVEFNAVILSVLRFAVPFLFLWLLSLIAVRSDCSWRWMLRRALVPGLLMGWMVSIQTIGMLYTNATKSGFITSLYVIIVPLFEAIYFRRRISWKTWILIIVGFAGMMLMTEIHGGKLNIGDLLTFFTAFLAALHILWIDRYSQSLPNPTMFNGAQCFWAALCSVPLLIFQSPKWIMPTQLSSWWGLIFLIVFSTLIAFTIQLRAQRVISATVSSLFFLLEAPFAAVFAGWFLDERLSSVQWWGAGLIFIAVLGATIEAREPKARQTEV